MGKLTRKVTLSEGAKAGIPMMQIAKVNRESTTFTILVRILIKKKISIA